MVSRTLGVAIACAIVALMQCPMAIYATNQHQKRRLANQVIFFWCLAAVFYRAAGGHWEKIDALFFIGLAVLAIALGARRHFTDKVGAVVTATIFLWSWGAMSGFTNLRDNGITALLCCGIIAGSVMYIRAYVIHLPETTVLLFNKEAR